MRSWIRAGEPRSDPWKQTIFWDIEPSKTAFVVIDMQNCFVSPGGEIEVPAARGIVPNINRICSACRALGIPVIWVGWSVRRDGKDTGLIRKFFPKSEASLSNQMGVIRGTLGTKMYAKLDVKPEDLTVMKKRTSAFLPNSSRLAGILRKMGRDTIIMAGVTTEACVGVSAKDAMMLDFKVVFMEDATTAMTTKIHNAAVEEIRYQWAMVCSTAQLERELRRTRAAARVS